jgi:hypothetical protein
VLTPLLLSVYFLQFCQLGGQAIIHKRNEPNLATGQSESKVDFLKNPA